MNDNLFGWSDKPNKTLSESGECPKADKVFFMRKHLKHTHHIHFPPQTSHIIDRNTLLLLISKGEWLNDLIIKSIIQLFNFKKKQHKVLVKNRFFKIASNFY